MAKPLGSALQKALGGHLQKARAGDGDFRWLHDLVLGAGYCVAVRGDGQVVLMDARQLSRRLGVAVRTIRNWIRSGLPVYARAHGNQPALYELFDVLDWRAARETADRGAAELAQGGTDHWLIEQRREQARKLRRENDVEEHKLIDAAEAEAQLAEIARIFRQEAEAIERAFGPEVGAEIRAMVGRAEGAWSDSFGMAAARPSKSQRKRGGKRKKKETRK